MLLFRFSHGLKGGAVSEICQVVGQTTVFRSVGEALRILVMCGDGT